MLRPIAVALLLGLTSCKKRLPTNPSELPLAVASTPRAPEVRYRPAEPPTDHGRDLTDAIPDSTWDAGLHTATQHILRALVDNRARITTEAVRAADALAGYPGQPHFLRRLNGGAFPNDLVEAIVIQSGGVATDVALARRTFSDGQTLWVIAWARHRAELDPLPRDLALDDALPVRVTTDKGDALRLFVTPPVGPVSELAISAEASRWVDEFHTPGPYRLEVVADRRGVSEVLLLFTVHVDAAPEPVPHLAWHPLPPPDPILAEAELFELLNDARRSHGLDPVRPFDLFRSVAREHSALMAAEGRLGHVIVGVTAGVARQAATVAHPKAEFYENVAVAATAEEAHALVEDSPGHFRNLLCADCTHATIGVAIEPVLNRRPRLFVTWELLRFPEGTPRPIPDRSGPR